MIHLAIIDESSDSLKKIVSYFKRSRNIELFASAANIQEFSEALNVKTPLLPDIVLISTLIGTIVRNEITLRVQKICPTAVVLNYNIVNNGETLVVSSCKGSLSFSGNSFAFNILDMVIRKSESDRIKHDSIVDSNDSTSCDVLDIPLRSRQKEVLIGLINGLTYNEVAAKISISINTVRYHIKELYKIFGVKNKIQLINKYNRKNFQTGGTLYSDIHYADYIIQ